ncbi:Afadin and alpha-actinin-binding-domain-containing protein [Lentinula raphanica]|nr:Afadin and alpha-actinin-binding-domain-containing protein [Lentinula raphanica]
MATPVATKTVHWNSEGSETSGFGSPSSQISDDSFVSTSSLQYVNSQLIAHGFASTPGLCLSGIPKEDMDKTVKCFLDLLAQRMKDMSRTEQLTTELRTLRYDHERMTSMHKTASESAANLEREVNLQKSRLASTTKTLRAAEAAHKLSNAELQRTRSALQTIRATHQAELKKKEKEIERTMDRWTKISDAQAKLSSTASGLRFGPSINAAVDPAVPVFGKGKSYLEVALEEAEKAREQLGKDNLGLRKMLLKAVNEVQTIAFQMQQNSSQPACGVEVPTSMTLPELFPLSPPDFTSATLSSSLARLREVLDILSSSTNSTTPSPSISPAPPQSEIEQLDQAIKPSKDDSRRYFANEITSRTKRMTGYLGHSRVRETMSGEPEIVAASSQNKERKTLPVRRNSKDERLTETDTTVQIGKDIVRVEDERTRPRITHESAHVETYTEHLPTEDDIETNTFAKLAATSTHKPRSSPRKTQYSAKTFQVNVGKAHRRTTRVGHARRRSSSSSFSLSPSKTRKDTEPSFETEFIPRLLPSISVEAPPLNLPTSSSTESLLPTAFVLPPPSPSASLPPPKPSLLLSAAPTILLPTPSLHTSNEPSEDHRTHAAPSPASDAVPGPSTPLAEARRAFPFPVAKPLANHMIHAYSPVRPSPLSRILMLGNSPDSPSNNASETDSESRGLEALIEEDELIAAELFPPVSRSRASSDDEGGLTLAQQLGISDSPPEPPVFKMPKSPQEQEVPSNATRKPRSSKSTTNRARLPSSGSTVGVPKSRASVDKGVGTKTKARSTGPPPVVKTTSKREHVNLTITEDNEKENSGHSSAVANPDLRVADREIKSTNTRAPNFGRGISAPRRVPVGSADAPPVGRRRKI